MSGPVTLRAVTADDEALLFELYASTRADEMALVGWDDEQQHDFLQMQFHAQSTDYSNRFPDVEHSIIRFGATDAGRIWIDRRADEIRLLDIIVHPVHRDAGIGTVLLRRLQDEATAAALPLRHSVDKSNPDALRLYERLGFRVVEDYGLYDLMEWIPPGTG